MPRPVIHDPDVFLDTAATLYADGGERAVTMAAVARASGASSGSLYHRFPDRGALLAALWLRTVTHFHNGIFEILDRTAPDSTVAIECAQHVVRWCSRNSAEARVLVAGRESVAPEPWPDPARAELRRLDARFAAAVRSMIGAEVTRSGTDPRVVRLAVVDLPYAAVRPFLIRGKPIPSHVEATVTAAARKLLA